VPLTRSALATAEPLVSTHRPMTYRGHIRNQQMQSTLELYGPSIKAWAASGGHRYHYQWRI